MIIRAWTVQDFGLPSYGHITVYMLRIVIQDTIIRVYIYICIGLRVTI